MNDLKSYRKKLAQLKAEHWKLDRVVLHLTAQSKDKSKALSAQDQNKLSEFKKRKLAIKDEIIKLQNELDKIFS